jgi:GMP synthase (glutamine-hydrolysing)
MRPVLVLQHGEEVTPGVLGEVLEARSVPHVVARLDLGEPVPGLGRADWAGIVSLGGEMGAYDTDEYPYLTAEMELLGAATAAAIPVLGICLGSQLLAEATGGRAYPAPRAEAAVVRFEPRDERPDPVIDQLVAPQLSFHRDTFELPSGAELLYSTVDYPQAYRIGRSIGVQTHPEIDCDVAAEWFGMSVGRVMLAESGADGEAILEDLRAAAGRSRDAARRFFSAWLDEVYAP